MFLTIKLLFEIELIICIKIDLALNNLQRLISHKTQNKQPTISTFVQAFDLSNLTYVSTQRF